MFLLIGPSRVFIKEHNFNLCEVPVKSPYIFSIYGIESAMGSRRGEIMLMISGSI